MDALPVSPRIPVRLADYQCEPTARWLVSASPIEIGGSREDDDLGEEDQDLIFAGHRLQSITDYRAAIQGWFKALRVGGRLVIVVPHAFLFERLLALPGRWDPAQRRLYTPASLMSEVEEALAPNSYRVRWLSDDDAGYDYGLDRDHPPIGASDVVVILERIAVPAWGLAETPPVRGFDPPYEFEPNRTRVEFQATASRAKILILKLDHLGDFIMGMPALKKARATFADSQITLVVGAWNIDIARRMNIADEVIAFDVFPNNSSEEEVDVRGKRALFEALVTGEYDLAIDLRTDTDTRFLLKLVRAKLRAGVGLRSRFEFLDIALPLDFNRNEPETAREFNFNHHAFSSQNDVFRNDFRITSNRGAAQSDRAIVWGPYVDLQSGQYIYEPLLELEPNPEGLLFMDVALDMERVAERTLPAPEGMRLRFEVDRPGARFEARIWALENTPQIGFNFYGGRLIRQGAASVLHQSEYLSLLIELIAMRVDRFGVLREAGRAA